MLSIYNWDKENERKRIIDVSNYNYYILFNGSSFKFWWKENFLNARVLHYNAIAIALGDTRNRCNPYTMLQERVTLEDTLAKILGRSREPKGHSE